VGLATSSAVAQGLLEANRHGWSLRALDRRALLERIGRADLEQALAVCRQRTVVSAIGEPSIVEPALRGPQATR
jgi:hypothetical protein